MASSSSVAKGVHLLGVVRVADRAVLASYATGHLTAAALKELVAARSAPPEAERKTTVEGEKEEVHFVADGKGLVYAVATAKGYPMRVAFACLDELRLGVDARHDPEQLLEAKDGGKTKSLKPLLKELAGKYADPAVADKVLAVQAKVDVVRETMQDSLATLLQNDEKLESLQQATEALTQQAKMFQNKTTQLRRNMRWEELRWKLMLALLVAFVLTVVVTPAVMAAKKHNKDDINKP